MKKEKEYTEKQISDRALIFEKCFFIAIALVFCMDMLNGSFGIVIGTHTACIISFWSAITICTTMLLVKECYSRPDDNLGLMILFAVWGIVGGVSFVEEIGDVLNRRILVVQEGELAEPFLQLFITTCILLMSIVFWIKVLCKKRKENKNEVC